ncbi:bifunctional phosphoribosylaminoimidazolecarboxamide formyltransferase/IMP cyclohydrolase [Vagococcus sp.]|uniref:bifunctional phosphoribosylaminoimidazolecarboxamide formyltransferase/IMP cyclohydrolase n=1 Tax=Vagococcus sp. TaxID=1933889 RepID=UPI002FC7FA63
MIKKRALISVSDKTGIIDFAKQIEALNFEIISTGGTQKTLDEAGISTINIESVTDFPEILDGRVKTLHPTIHGGLLAKRDNDNHMKMLEKHMIQPIDMVCVNLYPFKETLLNETSSEEEKIENIDIGGPSMLRSASKNFQSVTVLTDSSDFSKVVTEIKRHGETTLETRKRLAAKAFRHTASYDALIATYLTNSVKEKETESLTLTYDLKQVLRYGENSHQEACFYEDKIADPYSLAQAKQLHGKELSFNNIRDADACLRIIREFETPAVVAVKHMNPCGIGLGKTIEDAFTHAYSSDPVSIFGGIVALNQEVTLAVADKMSKIFLEIIIAPSFSNEAYTLLSEKKNIRLLTLEMDESLNLKEKDYISVLGGMLIQEVDQQKETSANWQVVTKRHPSKNEMEALIFANKSVKHVKSNGIVLTNNYQTLGIGAGQMNRVGAVKIALDQASEKLEGAVLASDAFFPMSDSIELIGKSGVKAIIQPGGSIKDQDSIDMANKYDIAMIFTNVRHFKH